MDGLSLSYPAVGAIVASMIAGLISFIVTVLAKDQKISEFRQDWINDLRNDTAELTSHLSISSFVQRVKELDKNIGSEFDAKYNDFVALKSCIIRIRLRLNVVEHAKLLGLLKRYDSGDWSTQIQVEIALDEFVEEVQKVLKLEWEKVKRGGKAVRIVKWFGLLVFIFMLTYALFSNWGVISEKILFIHHWACG